MPPQTRAAGASAGGAGGAASPGGEGEGADAKAELAARVRARMDTQEQDAFMREFESMVVCPLCGNPIVEPTAIACTHTFCRECIDDHLSDNSYCPKCQQPSYRKDMQPNNGMKPILESFVELARVMAEDGLRYPYPPPTPVAQSPSSEAGEMEQQEQADGKLPRATHETQDPFSVWGEPEAPSAAPGTVDEEQEQEVVEVLGQRQGSSSAAAAAEEDEEVQVIEPMEQGQLLPHPQHRPAHAASSPDDAMMVDLTGSTPAKGGKEEEGHQVQSGSAAPAARPSMAAVKPEPQGGGGGFFAAVKEKASQAMQWMSSRDRRQQQSQQQPPPPSAAPAAAAHQTRMTQFVTTKRKEREEGASGWGSRSSPKQARPSPPSGGSRGDGAAECIVIDEEVMMEAPSPPLLPSAPPAPPVSLSPPAAAAAAAAGPQLSQECDKQQRHQQQHESPELQLSHPPAPPAASPVLLRDEQPGAEASLAVVESMDLAAPARGPQGIGPVSGGGLRPPQARGAPAGGLAAVGESETLGPESVALRLMREPVPPPPLPPPIRDRSGETPGGPPASKQPSQAFSHISEDLLEGAHPEEREAGLDEQGQQDRQQQPRHEQEQEQPSSLQAPALRDAREGTCDSPSLLLMEPPTAPPAAATSKGPASMRPPAARAGARTCAAAAAEGVMRDTQGRGMDAVLCGSSKEGAAQESYVGVPPTQWPHVNESLAALGGSPSALEEARARAGAALSAGGGGGSRVVRDTQVVQHMAFAAAAAAAGDDGGRQQGEEAVIPDSCPVHDGSPVAAAGQGVGATPPVSGNGAGEGGAADEHEASTPDAASAGPVAAAAPAPSPGAPAAPLEGQQGQAGDEPDMATTPLSPPAAAAGAHATSTGTLVDTGSGTGARPIPHRVVHKVTTQDILALQGDLNEAMEDVRLLGTQERQEVARGVLGASSSSLSSAGLSVDGEETVAAAGPDHGCEQHATDRPVVVALVGVSGQQIQHLRESNLAALGVTLSEGGLTMATTHVAINPKGSPQPLARTPVYLEALLRGLAVVRVDWLWDSLLEQEERLQKRGTDDQSAAAAAAAVVLPPISKYFVSDAATRSVAAAGRESAGGPREAGLLSGCDVVLSIGTDDTPQGFPPIVLTRLIKLAGGRVLGGAREPGGTPGGGGGGLEVAVPPGGPQGRLLVVEADTSAPFGLEQLGAEWAAASSAIAVRRLSVEDLLDAFAGLCLRPK